MKLVKESLNRFERGLDPKSALCIGREAKIRKCFSDLNIHDEDYEILFNGVIYNGYLFLKDKNVVWLPDNLVVTDSLNLINTSIKVLPNGLIVKGWIDLCGTNITELPEDLKVKYNIYVDKSQKELIDFMQNNNYFANKLTTV